MPRSRARSRSRTTTCQLPRTSVGSSISASAGRTSSSTKARTRCRASCSSGGTGKSMVGGLVGFGGAVAVTTRECPTTATAGFVQCLFSVCGPAGRARPSRMTRLLTALCVLVGAFALATPAQAARSQDLVFDAPRDLLDPNRRAASLDEIQRLGVRSLRVVLYWKNVAPSASARRRPGGDLSDPAAYSWGDYER